MRERQWLLSLRNGRAGPRYVARMGRTVEIYVRLRPPAPTPADELCSCPQGTPTKLMSAGGLGFNPLHCLRCNLEVRPERIGFGGELAEASPAGSGPTGRLTRSSSNQAPTRRGRERSSSTPRPHRTSRGFGSRGSSTSSAAATSGFGNRIPTTTSGRARPAPSATSRSNRTRKGSSRNWSASVTEWSSSARNAPGSVPISSFTGSRPRRSCCRREEKRDPRIGGLLHPVKAAATQSLWQCAASDSESHRPPCYSSSSALATRGSQFG